MFEKIISHIERRRLFYAATPVERELRRHYAARNAKVAPPVSTPLVTIQGMRLDPFYYSLFGEVVLALRAKMPIRVEQCDLLGLRPHALASVWMYITSWLCWNPIAAGAWTRHYGAYCDGLAYRAFGFFSPLQELQIWLNAKSIWRGLKSSDQLAALTMRGISVGDLVIDSYLRFKPAPHVDIGNPYLFVVIRQALKDVDRAFAYFSKNKPKIYLTSYLSYVQHGIPARVAASLGVPVFSLLGNRQKFAKSVTNEDYAPSEKSIHYRQDFEAMPDRAGKLAAGEAALHARISGKRDMTNADMKTSQYEIKTTDVPDVRDAIVVFLHDFYDAPHEGEWMVYQDFWEWVCATIEILQNAKRPFHIKPHPTQRPNSDAEVARIKRLYPECKFISPDITNTQLVVGGMACAVTVHGSVAAEMAYLGIPTICAGDNVHISFNFCLTARSKSEYRQLLENYRDIKRDKAEMKIEACAFYYMYNYNLDETGRSLRDCALTLRSSIHNDLTDRRAFFPLAVIDGFQRVVNEPEFAKFIDKLVSILSAAPHEDTPRTLFARPVTSAGDEYIPAGRTRHTNE